jgi:predicted Zn-dependent peptidase
VLPDGVSLLPEVIDMMTELLFHPARQEDGELISRYVESERGHLIDAIASLVNHPASYAHAHFNAAFARDRDAIAPIRMEEVEALQERDLRELLHSIHTQAHFHAFYIGATPPEQLLRILAEHMGPILGQSQPPMPQLGGTALPARAQVLTVEEQLPSGQSHLIIGYRTPITLASPAYGAMMVCNEMLGGSPVSRLFTQLREAKSLCYSCYSDYLPDRGELMASCAIDRADRQAAQTAIREQIEALKCGDFTDAEMDAAKNLLLNGYLQLEDSTRSISSFYRVRHLMGVTQTIDECRAAISAVSRKQLICAANTLQEDTVYFLEGTATNAAGDEEDEYEDDNE